MANKHIAILFGVVGAIIGVVLSTLFISRLTGTPFLGQFSMYRAVLHDLTSSKHAEFKFVAPPEMVKEQLQYERRQHFEEWRRTHPNEKDITGM